MIYIGGASINEYGQLEGGIPGDQTGREVYIQPYYNHEKGWVLIRAKNKAVRDKLAEDCVYACENDNIGYSYWQHCYSLYNEAKRFGFNCEYVDTPCETNCAKLVLVCAKYAGVDVEDFSTADEAEKFEKTGMFIVVRDTNFTSNPENLITGDILVTATKGHTVIVTKGNDMRYEWCVNNAYCRVGVTTGDCHVRMFPTTDSESLTVLVKDTCVLFDGLIVVDESGKIWYHTPKYEGFISERMIGYGEEKS